MYNVTPVHVCYIIFNEFVIIKRAPPPPYPSKTILVLLNSYSEGNLTFFSFSDVNFAAKQTKVSVSWGGGTAATCFPGSFFEKDPGCGWSRVTANNYRLRGRGRNIISHVFKTWSFQGSTGCVKSRLFRNPSI